MRHDTDVQAEQTPSLVHLEGSGYKVADGDPDVRGWEVTGSDGRRIGEVDDLLIDPAALRVRYLEVRLDSLRDTDEGVIGQAVVPGVVPPSTLSGSIEEYVVRASLSDIENEMTADHRIGEHPYPGEEHILIPIGRARLDPDHDRILVDLRAEDALLLPPYKRGELTPELEERLRRAFGGADTDDVHAHDLYDEDRFYHPRRSRRPGATTGR